MMKKIYKKSQLLEVNDIPLEVIEGIKATIGIQYYACGSWKNKSTAVCNSNSIRVDKANEYVFNKISELLSNKKMVENIVNNINRERQKKINPAKKELERIDKELEKIEKKKTKLFEGYEEDLISKEEFKERKYELNKIAKSLQEEKEPLLVALSDDVSEEIPYEFIKSILENFGKVLTESATREQQKKLLHMIISEITINEEREIDSIKLKINDSLVDYINKEEGVYFILNLCAKFSLKSQPSIYSKYGKWIL